MSTDFGETAMTRPRDENRSLGSDVSVRGELLHDIKIPAITIAPRRQKARITDVVGEVAP
jgi:hypothetical protein